MVVSFIEEVLEENVERGDVQTAVAIVCMLDRYALQYLEEQHVADLVLSYLDLLQRDGLLVEAVALFERTRHYAAVERYFVSEQRLISKCPSSRCRETMRNQHCTKCGRKAQCNGCFADLDAPQRGLKHADLLIWCQICGHGGHFDCMREWFSNKAVCAMDGCKHRCQPVLIRFERRR